jgi:vacuolar protein sorting-associated protein VTA1
MSLLEIPAEYRPISPYVKIAVQFTETDQVLYYWCKFFDSSFRFHKIPLVLNYSVEKALTIGHSNPASKQYLMQLLDVLEKVSIYPNIVIISVQIKTQHPGDESYAVGAVAQCHVEAKALRLFTTADEQDRQGIFNKNVIKLFYTSGLLFDILSMFTKEELEEKLQVPQANFVLIYPFYLFCRKRGNMPNGRRPR